MSNWQTLIPGIVHDEPIDEAQFNERLDAFMLQIAADTPPIIDLASCLGPYLTSDAIPPRTRAIALLSQVVKDVPQLIQTDKDVHHLAEFFTSRLTDWPAIRGALLGCLALLQRNTTTRSSNPTENQPALLTTEDAVEMMKVYVQHVFIRSLGAQDRAQALHALRLALESYGQALLDATLDLMEYTISSIDGEKDPRCLLEGFAAVRALLALYAQQPESSLAAGDLEDNASELFDILSCYFPVSFTPSPNDTARITRENLSDSLQQTFAASTLFADDVVPLAMEKLSSTLRQAKIDAMSLLALCTEAYGPEVMSRHAATIWAALKGELVAPAAEGLLPADQENAEGVADSAAKCLGRCVAVFQQAGNFSLVDSFLKDTMLVDMFACIRSADQGISTGGPSFRRTVLRTKMAVAGLRALCSAGGEAQSKVVSTVVPQLVDILNVEDQHSGLVRRCLVWLSLGGVLQGSTGSSEGKNAVVSTPGAILSQIVTQALQDIQSIKNTSGFSQDSSSREETKELALPQSWSTAVDDYNSLSLARAILDALHTTLASPATAELLAPEQANDILRMLVDLILMPHDVAANNDAVQSEAVACLDAMAKSKYESLIAGTGLDMLMTSAVETSNKGAFEAVRTLAAGNRKLQAPVLLSIGDAAVTALMQNSNKYVATTSLLVTYSQIMSAASLEGGYYPDIQQAGASFLEKMYSAVFSNDNTIYEAAEQQPAFVDALARSVFTATRASTADLSSSLLAQCLVWLQSLTQQNDHDGPRAATMCGAVASGILTGLKGDALISAISNDVLPVVVSKLIYVALKDRVVAPYASQAVASILNKYQDGTAVADEVSSNILQNTIYPLILNTAAGQNPSTPSGALRSMEIDDNSNTLISSTTSLQGDGVQNAWIVLQALGHGLLLRASKIGDNLIGQIVQWLSDPTKGSIWSSAAHALGVLLQDNGGDDTAVVVNKKSFAVFKLLWQQRAYTLALKSIRSALARAAAGKEPMAIDNNNNIDLIPKHRDTKGSFTSVNDGLLTAQAHVLCAVDARILRNDAKATLGYVLECLLQFTAATGGSKLLVTALVATLVELLEMEAGLKAAEGDLSRIMPLVCELTRYQPSMAVRQSALDCLIALNRLPYPVVHSYRKIVDKAAAAATDDAKRAVRLNAAACRMVWKGTAA